MKASGALIDVYKRQEEEFDSPQPEEVNRRFSTEIRENVTSKRPELHQWFNKGSPLITNGSVVKFGFCSPSALIHFSLLRPVTQSASVKDARAKLWELSRASDISGIKNAALITAMPNENDPTIGPKQLEQLLKYKKDIEDEADAVNMRLHAVYNAVSYTHLDVYKRQGYMIECVSHQTVILAFRYPQYPCAVHPTFCLFSLFVYGCLS